MHSVVCSCDLTCFELLFLPSLLNLIYIIPSVSDNGDHERISLGSDNCLVTLNKIMCKVSTQFGPDSLQWLHCEKACMCSSAFGVTQPYAHTTGNVLNCFDSKLCRAFRFCWTCVTADKTDHRPVMCPITNFQHQQDKKKDNEKDC